MTRSAPDADLALWAAGATFFGLIGIVPAVMVALHLAGVLLGPGAVTAGVEAVLVGLPTRNGIPEGLRTLTATALGLAPLSVLVLLFPASLYGEGLRRALLQISPRRADWATGWRGRLGLLPVVLVAPVLLVPLLATAPFAGPRYAAGGWALVGAVVVAFLVVWVVLSIGLVLVFRFVGPDRPRRLVLVVAAFGTGSFLSGFLQGFLLFLAIPLEWSLPFGGLPVFGAVTALVLWLYLLHVVLLIGYRLLLQLDRDLAPGPTSR